ncbi:hypothetical protein [uncultured Senegalimassilia sp.]|uniref:hypothetical protein n=1 Tax=uncultured Senegalimassilia sp. TaxID=1714350 RepID=UPI0025F262CE|nr:hypothetical protein [uncultured Senegalimassilia sp.]
MIAEYSKVLIRSTNRIGTVVEFDDGKTSAIHLIELTDTDADDRMVWADAGDLEELPPNAFPALNES